MTTTKTTAAQMPKRTAAQQAELDRLRAEKSAATEQVIADAVAPKSKLELTQENIEAQAHKLVSQLRSAFGFDTEEGMPSFKRKMAAFFATIILAGGAGYGIGTIAGYAMAGIYLMSGSMLLAYLVMIMAVLLSAYVGMKIGQVVGNYVLSGQIDHDIKRAKNMVTRLFKREPKLAAA